MNRRFPAHPIVSVGAVVIDDGRVLLAQRGQEPLKGEWSLPGGVVEVGETLEAALAREVHEETGLSIRVGPVVEVLDRIQRTDDGRVEFHYVIVDYLCHPMDRGEPSAATDAADVRWVAESDVDRYRLTAKAAAVVRRAFAMSREEATRPR